MRPTSKRMPSESCSRDPNTPNAIDDQGMAHAMSQFMRAAGMDMHDEHLADTPQRVAALWRDHFLCGYAMDARDILSESIGDLPGDDAIFVFGLSFHSMCPHHLLPYQGRAHVAYWPDERIVGLGRLARLVDCFTRRLVLQEQASRQIVDAIMRYLSAKGAGCVLEAHQMCLGIPHDRHDHNKMVTCAFEGVFRERLDLQQRLIATRQQLGTTSRAQTT